MTIVSLVEIAGDRQDRGDDVQRQVVAEERQERERDQQVVDRRDDGAHGEAELEAEGDVEQDADEREHRRRDALLRQLAADRRADDLGADDGEVAEVAPSCSAASTCCRRRAQRRRPLGAHLRHADHHLVLRRVAVGLDDGVLPPPGSSGRAPTRTCSTDTGCSNCVDDDGAAGELDAAAACPSSQIVDDAGEDDDPRQRDGVPAPPQEVEVGVLEDMHG